MDKKTGAYADSDFVDVYDEAGRKLDPVPKRWLGTDLLPPGVTDKAPASADDVTIPEGAPNGDWTVPQLKAYADRESIDLDGATKKDDVLAKVTPPAS